MVKLDIYPSCQRRSSHPRRPDLQTDEPLRVRHLESVAVSYARLPLRKQYSGRRGVILASALISRPHLEKHQEESHDRCVQGETCFVPELGHGR